MTTRMVGGENRVEKAHSASYEVTNKQYKEFINNEGYRERKHWKNPFVKDGKILPWEEAITEFVDQTGRPGPSTWSGGDYPKGHEDYPVSGISWYEAAAYAEFVGKNLPTAYHWGIARGIVSSIIRYGAVVALLPKMNNFRGDGSVPVGSYPSLTANGAYDLAGNVREWCWNESQKGRIIRGGAWNDATYMYGNVTQAPPFDRSPKNGFRCAFYQDPRKIPEKAFQPYFFEEYDYYKVKPVPDPIFQVFKEQYFYDKTDLNSQVEWRDDSSEDWVQEKVTFNAAYTGEKVIVYLFLPKNSSPPYQTVIYFPGSGSRQQLSSKNLEKYWEFEHRLSFIVKNGRAVLYPIYKGTFERSNEALTALDTQSYQYTEYFIQLVKDFRRCVDYLETRSDIDSERLAFYGFSWGGRIAAIIPAIEERLKANIIVAGGLDRAGRPEVNSINYVTRVKIPTLMLNGKYDMVFSYETQVRPMFDLLGTPAAHKKLVTYETDHFIPRNELIKETLDWLDRYLGRVK